MYVSLHETSNQLNLIWDRGALNQSAFRITPDGSQVTVDDKNGSWVGHMQGSSLTHCAISLAIQINF